MVFKRLWIILLVVFALSACQPVNYNNNVKIGIHLETVAIDVQQLTNKNEGVAHFSTLYSAIVIDEFDTIQKVVIDQVETKVGVSVIGQIKLPLSYVTNSEKKDAYGLRKSSTIGKEWYQQINAIEKFLAGKKITDLKALNYTDYGAINHPDVLSSATINAKLIIDNLLKAVDNAVIVDGTLDKLGVYSTTMAENTVVATSQQSGLAKVTTALAVVALNEDNNVIHTQLDEIENDITYKIDGSFSEPTIHASKKQSLKTMTNESEQQQYKAWNEQISFFENYLMGTNLAKIEEIKLNEQNQALDKELADKVSIRLDYHLTNIIRAIQKAK